LAHAPKLLLTATPLQNSLLELFGLVSFIDEHVFGDLKSFKTKYVVANPSQVAPFDSMESAAEIMLQSKLLASGDLNDRLKLTALRKCLEPICHRTLRRQVTSYIPYTKRLPLLESFTPEESEDRLYHAVSNYLLRPNLQALPASQRSLTTLVLRKLLASSTFAIAGALTSMATRLRAKLAKKEPETPLSEELEEDYEALDETAEEWDDDLFPEEISEAIVVLFFRCPRLKDSYDIALSARRPEDQSALCG